MPIGFGVTARFREFNGDGGFVARLQGQEGSMNNLNKIDNYLDQHQGVNKTCLVVVNFVIVFWCSSMNHEDV